MDHKKLLIALVLVFTLVNAAFVFAANEPYGTLYSGFGGEDPDPDGDGIDNNIDKCPGSPFDILFFTKNTKKNPAVTNWLDAKGKTVYLRLKEITDKSVVFQTALTNKFSKAQTKSFTLAPNTILFIDTIGKRFKVVYLNSAKGVAVVWSAAPESKKKGCTTAESGGMDVDELTPP
ncbi:hypothetical protein HZC21_05680 [Candidatus Peregrinibacteria bacterium]|nr:hypothetical protein [Candidatus Peregrinibacteria bacterium]